MFTSPGGGAKMHKNRIMNHDQETGTSEVRHQKNGTAEDLGWKCNFEKIMS